VFGLPLDVEQERRIPREIFRGRRDLCPVSALDEAASNPREELAGRLAFPILDQLADGRTDIVDLYEQRPAASVVHVVAWLVARMRLAWRVDRKASGSERNVLHWAWAMEGATIATEMPRIPRAARK